jgi:very-short-patch-repair endonuclease
MGLRVLRFWVTEINEKLDGIVETIFEALTEAPLPTSPRFAGGGV